MPKFGLIWVFLGWNFKKLLSYLKSTSSNLPICRILGKKQKSLNFGPKMLYLGIFDQNALFRYFWDGILENFCHI